MSKHYKLTKYQHYCVERAFLRKNSYLAIPCGGGKTLTSLHIMAEQKCTLVICPASLCQNWEDEILKWGFAKKKDIFIVPKISSRIPELKRFIIVSYDKAIKGAIYKQLIIKPYDSVILDEAHKIKNPESKRTEALIGWATGKARLLTTPRVKKCLLLSGTPMMQRPFEMYSALRGLAPETLGKYIDKKAFGVHFCKGFQDNYGKWVFNGADNLKELAELTKDFIIRVSKEVIEAELPPLRQQIIRLDCCESLVKQEQAYHIDSLENLSGSVAFEGLSELRHMMAIQKIPLITEYINDLILSGEKVIIFTWHRAVINSILTSFPALLRIDGSVPTSSRSQLVNDFNTGKYPGAICQITAASEGLSFHTASHVVFAEVSWNPSDNEQAFKRVHRRGQEKPVLVHYLVAKNSLDDKIMQNVLTKERVVSTFDNELINNQPGVNYDPYI